VLALAVSAALLGALQAGARPAAGAVLTGATLAATATPSGHAPKPTVQHRPKVVRIPLYVFLREAEPGPTVPASFLGLSFEVEALPQLASYAERGDLVTLLRSLGPGVVRFGGVTADEDVAWTDALTPKPPWAPAVLDEGELRELGTLAASSGWHVLLTLGFGHYEPQADAREAAAAQAALGSSLEAIELGNEPDSYARHGLRQQPWTFVQYEEQVTVTRAAIEALAPGIPLAGPDTSGSSAYEKWGLGEAIDQRPALLTGHHYPLGCNDRPAPSIAQLLSPQIREAEEVSLRRYLFVAQQAEVPFRMDETNSVSCGGVPGISDTFASALWALSYATQAMSTGAAGINFEGNPVNCQGYTPLCAPTAEAMALGELHAQPEWYALLLARALVGERPQPARVVSPENADVVVSAFVAGDGALHFVIVNDDPPGDHEAAVALNVGRGFHGASVLSLSAPSPESTTGVSLGGQAVAPDGLWSPPTRLPHVPNRGGTITVDVPPSSAALVTVSALARG
jgi:hypothetical protein